MDLLFDLAEFKIVSVSWTFPVCSSTILLFRASKVFFIVWPDMCTGSLLNIGLSENIPDVCSLFGIDNDDMILARVEDGSL